MVSASERGGEDVIADAGTWNFVERVNGMRGHRFLPSSNFGRRHRTEGLDQLTWLSHKLLERKSDAEVVIPRRLLKGPDGHVPWEHGEAASSNG